MGSLLPLVESMPNALAPKNLAEVAVVVEERVFLADH
jgi:hypothetical protein